MPNYKQCTLTICGPPEPTTEIRNRLDIQPPNYDGRRPFVAVWEFPDGDGAISGRAADLVYEEQLDYPNVGDIIVLGYTFLTAYSPFLDWVEAMALAYPEVCFRLSYVGWQNSLSGVMTAFGDAVAYAEPPAEGVVMVAHEAEPIVIMKSRNWGPRDEVEAANDEGGIHSAEAEAQPEASSLPTATN